MEGYSSLPVCVSEQWRSYTRAYQGTGPGSGMPVPRCPGTRVSGHSSWKTVWLELDYMQEPYKSITEDFCLKPCFFSPSSIVFCWIREIAIFFQLFRDYISVN